MAEVRMVGELDVHTAGALVNLVEDLFRHDIGTILLDGAGLTFVDSAGLQAIVVGLVRASAAGVGYEVSAASESLDRVLSITGLAEVLGR